MTLPFDGPITMAQVATELGISQTGISLNHADVRALAGKPSGTISMNDLRGKSYVIPLTATLTGWTSPYVAATGFSTSRTSLQEAFGSIMPNNHAQLGLIDGFWCEYNGSIYSLKIQWRNPVTRAVRVHWNGSVFTFSATSSETYTRQQTTNVGVFNSLVVAGEIIIE